MKVSELWLRNIVNPSVSTETWVEQFTQAGIEVDSIEEAEPVNEETKPAKDTIITLKVPPNRSDCLSMEGLAREWAAMNKMSFSVPTHEIALPKIKDTFPHSIQAKEACPCYVGRILQNINAQAETPDWLKQRLEKAGLRSLSPVVDVTNYVMLELGQPMHAFDLAKLDSEISVRMATEKETIVTLEGKEVTLNTNCLVIADKSKPLAIAGIMGGELSSVTENTKSIFLEAAYFDPISIRKTSQRYKLRTESSLRFERGIDPLLQVKAMERATELLVKIVGGNAGPLVEQCALEYLPKPRNIFLRRARIAEILGITLEKNDVEGILTRLGMAFTFTSESSTTANASAIANASTTTQFPTSQSETIIEGWEVSVPSFRPDVSLEIDLIEELARIYGYQNIPEAQPFIPLEGQALPESQVSQAKIKDLLISRGYREAITYSFIAPELDQLLQRKEAPLALSNPISQEMSVMRESLLPGLLQALQHNQARQTLRVRLFESGTVFLNVKKDFNRENSYKASSSSSSSSDVLQEQSMLAGLASGSRFKEQWGEKTQNVDFFDVKNDIEVLLSLQNDSTLDEKALVQFHAGTHPLMHPGQTATIIVNESIVGYLGALHPSVLKQLDLQGPVILFELSLPAIQTVMRPKFRELSKYPAIRRDIAVLVDEKVLATELKSAIVNCVGSLLRDIWVFDVYQGKGIEPGRKSVAFSLLLQHPSRTLVEDEVNTMITKVVQQLTDKYHAILRE